MEEIERVNENPEFREYISYEEEQRKIRNEYKKEGYESGLADGIEQGIEQGLERGIEQGAKQKERLIVKKSEEKIREIENAKFWNYVRAEQIMIFC